METASNTDFELTTLDKRIFAIINNLRKHHKRTNLGNIYNELTKMEDFENTSKEHFCDRIIELYFQEKIINKPNRNDDLYYDNKGIVDFNMDQLEYFNLPTSDLSFATPNTKQLSSTGLMNTPRNSINTLPESPYLPQKDINAKESVRKNMVSETFTDNMSDMKIENRKTEIISSMQPTISFLCQKEFNTLKDNYRKLMQKSYSYYNQQMDNLRIEIKSKDKINMSEMKIQNLKTEIFSSLQSTISFLCKKELNTLKDNCEKLMQKWYSYFNEQIDNLRIEVESEVEIINKLSATPSKIISNFALVPNDPIVALNNNDLVTETAPSNCNENVLPYAVDCSMQHLVKDKEDCARILVSSTEINEQIADYRQQKSQQLVLFKKTARSGVSDKNRTMNDPSPDEVSHGWPVGTLVIVEDAIMTGIDEKEWTLVRRS